MKNKNTIATKKVENRGGARVGSGRPREYTEEELNEMYDLYINQRKTYTEIAEQFGCHKQTLSYRFKKMGLVRKNNHLIPRAKDRRYKKYSLY